MSNNQAKYTTNLRVLRAQANMSQGELAERVGVVRQTIAYIEQGEYMPSLKLAYDLAQVFELPIEEVFYFQN